MKIVSLTVTYLDNSTEVFTLHQSVANRVLTRWCDDPGIIKMEIR